jgi:hypothetical protein
MAKEDTLAEVAPAVTDRRPLFQPTTIDELGGPLRLRRLQPEQVVAIRQRLQAVGIGRTPVTVSPANRWTLEKLVQVSLVPADPANGKLLLKGDEGLARLAAVSEETLAGVAGEAIEFNGLLS